MRCRVSTKIHLFSMIVDSTKFHFIEIIELIVAFAIFKTELKSNYFLKLEFDLAFEEIGCHFGKIRRMNLKA